MYMQLTPRYLVKNKTVVVLDEAAHRTEYRKLYERTLNIVRGIDNLLTFEIKNADQKPVSILNTYTCKFEAFDENNTQVLDKLGTIIETTTPSYKGQFTVEITENDLNNIDGQLMTYVVYLTDSNGKNKITYADSQFGARGIIKIDSETFPGPKESYNVTTFTEYDPGVYTSESISAEPAINGNTALHTAAIYSTGFAGSVTIQGTLDNQDDTNTNWVDIATKTLTSPTEPVYENFNGVFNYLRFKYTKTSGTLDKILVRN